MYRVIATGLLASCLLAAQLNAQQPEEARADTATAIFAGGCFWCMEPPFDKLNGVIATTSGYTGGRLTDPTYEQVSRGGTGHYEAVRIRYDPAVIDYSDLLDVFWVNVDPLDSRGQFCDMGDQYLSAVFYQNEDEERLARESLTKAKRILLDRGFEDIPIATKILPAAPFYPAEDYHQDYYSKNPIRYRFYRLTCGRDGRLDELWNDLDALRAGR